MSHFDTRMTGGNSAQNEGVTSDERIRNVLRRFIQRAYDLRDFTREGLARETGISVHTLDAIVSRDAAKQRRIAAEDAFNIAYALGDATVAALVGCIHFTASRPCSVSVEARDILAAILPHIAVIAKAAADGRIDHVEAPVCRDAADQIISMIAPLSSAGYAA